MNSSEIIAALKHDLLAAHWSGHAINMDYEGVDRATNRQTNTIRWERGTEGCGLCAAGAHLLTIQLPYDRMDPLDDEAYFAQSVGRSRIYGLAFFNGSTYDPQPLPAAIRSIELYLHFPLDYSRRLEAEQGYADGRLMVAWVTSETRPGGLLDPNHVILEPA